MEYKQLNIFDIAADNVAKDKTIRKRDRPMVLESHKRNSTFFEANSEHFREKANKLKELQKTPDFSNVGVDGQMSMKFNQEKDFIGYVGGAIGDNAEGKIAKAISNYKVPIAIGGAVLGGMAIQKIFSNDDKRN